MLDYANETFWQLIIQVKISKSVNYIMIRNIYTYEYIYYLC